MWTSLEDLQCLEHEIFYNQRGKPVNICNVYNHASPSMETNNENSKNKQKKTGKQMRYIYFFLNI